MFRKLRLKLALTNAAVAGLILVAIALVAYLFLAYIIERQSEQAINLVARSMEAGDTVQAGGLYPYFVLSLDDSGSISVDQFHIHLTESQMNELASQALTREQTFFQNLSKVTDDQERRKLFSRRGHSAVVSTSDGRQFRYSLTGFRPGSSSVYLIFLDIQQEQAMLRSVQLALGACVLGGLLLTLLGGLFLAGRALRPIREAWQKQRNFVADASHELRSPLAAIRCNLDVVLDDPTLPVADKQPFWEGISEETNRMTTLVDELLLLARADSDAVVLQKEPVNLASVAEAATGVMQPLAQKKRITLTLDASARPTVIGDAARLKQVLIALIDNAIKYTPEGGDVTVRLRQTKDRAVLEVRDTGIGIPREHLGRIFERFYREDQARERESGGYGLGLSIAQWIVLQHGGTISVTSEEGKGSCFTVTLPLTKNEPCPTRNK